MCARVAGLNCNNLFLPPPIFLADSSRFLRLLRGPYVSFDLFDFFFFAPESVA
jgi:hypothetical protein